MKPFIQQIAFNAVKRFCKRTKYCSANVVQKAKYFQKVSAS